MKYVLWLVFLVSLTACQTKQGATHQNSVTGKNRVAVHNKNNKTNDHDGAPSGPLPSFFQKIFPMHAPLSRYGNPGAYKVRGHTYEVMTSSRGYHARGLASWYGTKFHSKRTSSGEGYNMYALTAAHKTLPLPTYVRVKNLSNGREAIVKVNDRGPFAPNRILDLSYAAAVKLNMLAHGTALVQVTAIDPNHLNVVPQAVYFSHKPHLYLQLGAFTRFANAEKQLAIIRHYTNKPAYINRIAYHHVILYKVRIGPLKNVDDSDILQAKLEHEGAGRVIILVI